VATARRKRTLAVPQQQLWELLADPHHIRAGGPEWTAWRAWRTIASPRCSRPKRGRPVRADFRVVMSDPPWMRSWAQEVAGTPFERVLNESVIEVELKPAGGATEVTLAHHQKLRGYSRTGGFMLRRATAAKLDEALDGLERICG